MSAAASYWRNAVRHPEDCGVGNIRRTFDYTEFGNLAGEYPAYALPIGCLEAGAVPLRISTYVQTAVTGGTPAVTIGTAVTPTAFALAADIAAGTTGYKTAATGAEMGKTFAADTIFYAYLSTGALAGKFTVTVEFANRREAAPETGTEDAGEGGGGEEEGLEELAFSDFVNGVYRIGGATVAVEDMWTMDGDFGSFDPGGDITSDGLVNGYPISTAALAGLLFPDGYTVVGMFDIQPASTSLSVVMITSVVLPAYSTSSKARMYCDNSVSLTQPTSVIASSGQVTRTAETGYGPFYFAVTVTATRVSLSINGGSVLTDTTTDPLTLTYNTMALEIEGSKSWLKHITFHPPQPDADLPGLSEP